MLCAFLPTESENFSFHKVITFHQFLSRITTCTWSTFIWGFHAGIFR